MFRTAARELSVPLKHAIEVINRVGQKAILGRAGSSKKSNRFD